MAKRSPKQRAANKRSQRKTNQRRKQTTRRKVNQQAIAHGHKPILPKPIAAARQPTRRIPIVRDYSPDDFGGYPLPELDPVPQEYLDARDALSIDEKRQLFEEWANTHSQVHSSSYWPDMPDAQVSQAYDVFVFNKEIGYGSVIEIGPSIREYMHDWDLDENLDDADEENYL